MSEVREFHIGDILSVTTGILVSERHMDGIHDLLDFMTGDTLFTHQLPRAIDECAPELRRQLPTIGAIKFPKRLEGDGPLSAMAWLARQVERFGAVHPVSPLHPDDHTHINPVVELQSMMRPDASIVVVEVPDAEA